MESVKIEMQTPIEASATPTVILDNKQTDIKGEFKSNIVSSQTLSPEGSIVSPVSSLGSAEEKKRRFSNIEEETSDDNSLKSGNESPDIKKSNIAKLSIMESVSEKHLGENDLNFVDKDTTMILEDIRNSINQAEIALNGKSQNDDTIRRLLESLNKSKSLILKLNLDKNLSRFQMNSELEQSNIEKQILVRNLETFQTNLKTLMMDNTNLNDKNMKLIKYYKNLKYGKFKDLKLKNSQLIEELDSIKHTHTHGQSTSSSSSSGRSSVTYSQKKGENNMLNTLGILASQVLANEEPQTQKKLPPTFGSISSQKESLKDDENVLEE